MDKKEFYRHALPHFQQPGQAYFVTWSLIDAVPSKALLSYTQNVELLRNQLKTQMESGCSTSVIEELKRALNDARRKYIKAYNDLLDLDQNTVVNLSKPDLTQVIISSIMFWEGKRLNNYAFTIMNNHVHWVFQTFNKDDNGKAVYLEEILKSVKQFSARQINLLENRQGSLWQKENFDTTIRNPEHMYNAINYTLNNPVSAGLVSDWKLWPGSYMSKNI